MRLVFAIHPWLLVTFPVLAIFSENTEYVRLTALFRALLVAEVAVSIVWFICRIAVRDKVTASLLTSTLVLLMYGFGPLSDALGTLSGQIPHKDLAFLTLLVVFIVVGARFFLRPAVRPAATRFLGTLGACLVCVSSVFTIYRWQQTEGQSTVRPAAFDQPIHFTDRPPRSLPDVYIIILDAYGRGDVLQGVYGYDNSGFLTSLTELGFVVADRSLTNYPKTMLSLASSLNLEYLHTLLGSPLARTFDTNRLAELIQNNRFVRVLRERHGYQFIAFESGYEWTECRGADQYLGPQSRLSYGEFGNSILALTPFPALLEKLWNVSPFRWHRERILHALENLPHVATIEGPTITFTHIVCPHPPFVFDEDGNASVQPEGSFRLVDVAFSGSYQASRMGIFRDRYRKQVHFISTRIANTIQEILARSNSPPIIVLQSDHGPPSRAPLPRRLWESLSILNAVFLPGFAASKVPRDLTPVNSFRLILSHYFGAVLPQLPNEHYYDDQRRDPRDFADYGVTRPVSRR